MKKGSLRINKDSNSEIKILPCRIDYNGEIDTQGYVPDESIGSLFGRKLQGQTIQLPQSFKGYVANGSTELTINETFTEIKYWNWDSVPNELDPIPQLLNHLQIMNKLYEA